MIIKMYFPLMLHVQYRSANWLVYRSQSGIQAGGGFQLERVFHYYHLGKKEIYMVNCALAQHFYQNKLCHFCSRSIGQIKLCVHVEPERG